jgi:cell division septation protein DedD
MTGKKMLSGLLAVTLLMAAAGAALLSGGSPSQANPGVSLAIDAIPAGNTATSLGAIDPCVSVSSGKTFDLDVTISGVTELQVWNLTFKYDPSVVNVVSRDVLMLLAANPGSNVTDLSYGDPSHAGPYELEARDAAEQQAAHESGSGVLVRLTLQAVGPGKMPAILDLQDSLFWSYSVPHTIDVESIANAWIAVDQSCSGEPPPTSTPPTPYPTFTSTPATPTPETTGTPNPTATPTPGTPTPTTEPGTVQLVDGWNDSCYVGGEKSVEEAFAGVLDHVQAVYRMRPDQGFDRWFAGRPDASTISSVKPYDPLFVLASEGATWVHEQHGSPPDEIVLSKGWNSVCYAGAAKDAPSATAGIAGNFAVLYTLAATQSWQRYIPNRPEVSNLSDLFPSVSVLILVTADGDTVWTFSP